MATRITSNTPAVAASGESLVGNDLICFVVIAERKIPGRR
jgi:hypothetical protein